MRQLWVFLLPFMAIPAIAGEKLLACTEDADYPPFTYREKGNPARQLSGTTVGLMARLSAQINVPIEIVQVSLKRCLLGVERGTYDLGLDFYKDDERAGRFDFSPSYMALHPYYFYDKSRHPEGLDVQRKGDLQKLRGCGIIGYSYAHFGLQEGPKLDVAAQSHLVAGRMLFAGRCDYFPAAHEIMEGYRKMGETEIVDNPKLGFAPVPETRAQEIYLIYSRKSERLRPLRPAIDAFLLNEKATPKPPAR